MVLPTVSFVSALEACFDVHDRGLHDPGVMEKMTPTWRSKCPRDTPCASIVTLPGPVARYIVMNATRAL